MGFSRILTISEPESGKIRMVSSRDYFEPTGSDGATFSWVNIKCAQYITYLFVSVTDKACLFCNRLLT